MDKRKIVSDRLLALSKVRYAAGKFRQAVRILATGPGDVRSRLLDAYGVFYIVRVADLPDEVQEDYRWIQQKLTSQKARHQEEGEVEATLRTIRNNTGVQIATRLVRINDELQFLCQQPQELVERSNLIGQKRRNRAPAT